MSSSSKPRVIRKHKPKKVYTKNTYQKARPLLLEDFENRCAYSLMHIEQMHPKSMHVDHHNPHKKRKCGYDNLFPSFGPCNMAKLDIWPSKGELAAGLRFLNPCTETDYGVEIFEDPKTQELVGISPAAIYHIEVLDLNHPTLVKHRLERRKLVEMTRHPVIRRNSTRAGDESTIAIVRELRAILAHKIPLIKAPPLAKSFDGQ